MLLRKKVVAENEGQRVDRIIGKWYNKEKQFLNLGIRFDIQTSAWMIGCVS